MNSLGNCLTLERWQVTTWSSDDLFHWCLCVGRDVAIKTNLSAQKNQKNVLALSIYEEFDRDIHMC